MSKKPAKRIQTPHEIEMRRLHKEARASVSLDRGDGETQSCDACTLEKTAGKHRCGRREMTDAERAFIEAYLDETEGSIQRWVVACRALRTERERGGR